MADQTVVHIGENSPEEVALKLFHIIANIENRQDFAGGENPMDREWVLRTYAQCRSVVKASSNIDSIVERFQPTLNR